MTTTIRGTDNTAAAPALTGTDADTGIFFPAADTIAFAEGGAEVARFDSSGQLGIGTSSPNSTLNVVGAQTTFDTSVFGQVLVRSTAAYNATPRAGVVFSVKYNSAGAYIAGGSSIQGYKQTAVDGEFANGLLFTTQAEGQAPAERARLDSNGNLLVNTTNSNGSAFKFKVQTTTDVCMGFASATAVSGALTLNAINDANGANVPLDFRASSIHASNGIATTANAANANFSAGENNKFYRSTSALKYKQDIRDIELIDINRFRPVRYKSKCEDDDQTKDHFGIIADEVHAAGLTELVTYGVEQEVEGFQYERLTVVLLKHCQEQQAIIQSLTDRIAALEAKG